MKALRRTTSNSEHYDEHHKAGGWDDGCVSVQKISLENPIIKMNAMSFAFLIVGAVVSLYINE